MIKFLEAADAEDKAKLQQKCSSMLILSYGCYLYICCMIKVWTRWISEVFYVCHM